MCLIWWKIGKIVSSWGNFNFCVSDDGTLANLYHQTEIQSFEASYKYKLEKGTILIHSSWASSKVGFIDFLRIFIVIVRAELCGKKILILNALFFAFQKLLVSRQGILWKVKLLMRNSNCLCPFDLGCYRRGEVQVFCVTKRWWWRRTEWKQIKERKIILFSRACGSHKLIFTKIFTLKALSTVCLVRCNSVSRLNWVLNSLLITKYVSSETQISLITLHFPSFFFLSVSSDD